MELIDYLLFFGTMLIANVVVAYQVGMSLSLTYILQVVQFHTLDMMNGNSSHTNHSRYLNDMDSFHSIESTSTQNESIIYSIPTDHLTQYTFFSGLSMSIQSICLWYILWELSQYNTQKSDKFLCIIVIPTVLIVLGIVSHPSGLHTLTSSEIGIIIGVVIGLQVYIVGLFTWIQHKGIVPVLLLTIALPLIVGPVSTDGNIFLWPFFGLLGLLMGFLICFQGMFGLR